MLHCLQTEFPCAEYREDTHPKRLLDDISSDAGSKVPLLLKSALKSDTSRKLGIAKPRRKRVKFTVDTHKSTASRTSTPLSKRLKILALDLDRLDGLPDIIFRSTNKQKTRRTRHLKSYIRFGIKDVAMLRATQEQETMVDQAILKCLREFKKGNRKEKKKLLVLWMFDRIFTWERCLLAPWWSLKQCLL